MCHRKAWAMGFVHTSYPILRPSNNDWCTAEQHTDKGGRNSMDKYSIGKISTADH